MADQDDLKGRKAQEKIDTILASLQFQLYDTLEQAGYKIMDQQSQQGSISYVLPLQRLPGDNENPPTVYAGKFTTRFKHDGDQDIRREVATLIALQEVPGIMRYYQSFMTSTDFVIVTEYFAGSTCDEVLTRQGFFPEPQLRMHAKSLFSTLAEIHDRGFLMADIKAENVMFQDDKIDSRIAFIDYGAIVPATHDNAHGPIMWTRYAQSPEIYLSCPVYQEHDIWTMGVLLYRMACGNTPFADDGSKVFHTPDYTGVIWECHSKELQDFIKKCLEEIPSDRFTAVQALEHEWFASIDLLTEEQHRQMVRRHFMINLARRLFHLVSFALRLQEHLDPIN